MARKDNLDPGQPGASPSEAFWQCPEASIARHQSPVLASEASVVIIGSGITGASIAYHLLKASPNLDIVMLEARTITSGATGRNGGHCKDVPYKTYQEWKTTFGKKAAQRLSKFRMSHLEAIRQMADELRRDGYIDSQFRDVESVNVFLDPAKFQAYKSNMEHWLDDFPEERGRWSALERNDLHKKYGIKGGFGALTGPAAALWPYRLITSLLEKLSRNQPNFSVEALTPVVSISTNDSTTHPYVVHTPRGVISTKHIVHCTNGHVAHLLPALRGKVVPLRGQMTALATPDQFPSHGHERSWSFYYPNGGFDYMTQAPDARGTVYLGGGVEHAATAGVVDLNSTDDANVNAPALDHLCSVLPTYFEGGQGTKLEKQWTGIMGFTPDSLPIVGIIPPELSPRKMPKGSAGAEWVAAGFNGYGMVYCWQSGRAISDMILGIPVEELKAYFPMEQFECSVERLQKLDYKDLQAVSFKNVPPHIRSRL